MQTEIHESAFKREKTPIFTMHVLITERVVQGGCGLFRVFRDLQNPACHSPC